MRIKFQEKYFLAGLFAFNLLLRFLRLDQPSYPYFDEKPYYVKAVRAILAGKPDPNFEHPPFSKELIALAVKTFGDNGFAWRCTQALLASVAVIAVYFLAKKMFGSKPIAALSSLLLTIEFSWFVNSRVAIPEMFMASLAFIAFFFFYLFYKEQKLKFLAIGSIIFGLALASKWTAVLLLPIIFYIVFSKVDIGKAARRLIIIGMLTAAVYLAAYIPFFLQHTPGDFIALQEKMLHYHTVEYSQSAEKYQKNLKQFQVIGYPAYVWPLNNFYTYNYEKDGNDLKIIVLFYHPFILWGALVLVVFRLKKIFLRQLGREEGLLIAGFLIFWLPWLFVQRITYPYYWLAGIPFATILLGKFAYEKYQKSKNLVVGVLVTALVLFILYYPILSNWPVKEWYLKLLTGAL